MVVGWWLERMRGCWKSDGDGDWDWRADKLFGRSVLRSGGRWNFVWGVGVVVAGWFLNRHGVQKLGQFLQRKKYGETVNDKR